MPYYDDAGAYSERRARLAASWDQARAQQRLDYVQRQPLQVCFTAVHCSAVILTAQAAYAGRFSAATSKWVALAQALALDHVQPQVQPHLPSFLSFTCYMSHIM